MLDARSESRLIGVDARLVKIVHGAADILAEKGTGLSFVVTEGVRTRARQVELVKAGASQTMNSRHLTGGAVDVAAKIGGEIRWDWPLYARIAEAFKESARDLGFVITWGGDWKRFKDGPHFQIEDGATV